VTMRRKLGKDGLLGEAADGAGILTSLVKSGIVARELVGITVWLHVGDELLGILSIVTKRANERELLAKRMSTDLRVLTTLTIPGLRGQIGPELNVEHALSLAMIRRSHARTSDFSSLDADSLGNETTTAILGRGVEDSCITRWRTSSSENRGSEVQAQDLSLDKIGVSHDLLSFTIPKKKVH